MQSLTTTTDLSTKGGKTSLSGKVSAKWARDNFSLDKLEVKNDGSIITESSLTGVYPGLKFEFKGDDTFKGDLGLVYKCSAATVTSEVDLVEFSGLKASAVAQAGPVQIGASAEIRTEKFDLKGLDVSAIYPMNDILVGLKTTNKFATYGVCAGFTPAGAKHALYANLAFSPEKGDLSGVVAGTYRICSSTSLKVKASNAGVISASYKQVLEPKTTLVAATQVDVRDPTNFRFGLTATLG
jgi:hypothetical protein